MTPPAPSNDFELNRKDKVKRLTYRCGSRSSAVYWYTRGSQRRLPHFKPQQEQFLANLSHGLLTCTWEKQQQRQFGHNVLWHWMDRLETSKRNGNKFGYELSRDTPSLIRVSAHPPPPAPVIFECRPRAAVTWHILSKEGWLTPNTDSRSWLRSINFCEKNVHKDDVRLYRFPKLRHYRTAKLQYSLHHRQHSTSSFS